MKNKILSIVAFIAAIFFCLDTFGQGTVTLGTGTTYNSNTAFPTPYGTYRKNIRVQYLVLKSELNALGVAAGNITAIGFNVYALSTIKDMPGYSIKMKSTTATTQGTVFDNADLKEVWYNASFIPVTGWNTHTFSSPFYWDNNSNILIDICFDMLSTTTTRNAQVYYTSNGTYMATHYNSDNYTACGTTTSASRSYNRANMQITWATTTCPPPMNLTAQNMTISTAQLGWTERGSATQWNVEVGLPDFLPGTGTSVKNVTATTSNPWTVSGLDSLTLYEFYVKANCGGSLSQWEGPYEFQTTGSPLSGDYTIDKTQATLGKNFNSFNDMAKALNTSLIEGPVSINVVSGTGPYTEQLILTEFTGSSATNTVTINGNGDTLQYYSTNNLELATLKLKGTDYLTVNNLTIKALATGTYEYGYAVHLMDGADYNTFDSCSFKANTSSNSSNYAAFVASNAIAAPETAGLVANNLTISNCKIEGGYYGIVVQGPTSAPFADSNVITNNEVMDFFSYGIYTRGQNNALVSENKISRPARTSSSTMYGLYMTSDMSGTKVTKNQISNFSSVANSNSFTAMRYLSVNTLSGAALEISNNIVFGFQNMTGSQEGIYINSSSTPCIVNIYHNTFSFDNTTQTGSGNVFGISFQSSSGGAVADIRNNIISCTSSSTGTKNLIHYDGSFTLTSDYNVLYMGSTVGSNYTAFWASNFNTLSDWQVYNSNAYDQNSYDLNPQFVLPLLTPRRYAFDNNGANLSSVVIDDIFSVARPATPDPGAIEFEGIICVPPTTLTVSDILDNAASMGWTEIGTASQWNVEVGLPGFTPDNGEEIISGTGVTDNPWTASGLSYYTDYEFYVQSDCGSGNTSTWEGPFAFKTLAQLMSGTYTINSSEPTGGTNFNSFTDLATRLNNGGFDGPVTINVVQSTGPYTEAFVLNELNFSSAVNTLTINGNNETLQFLSTDNNQRATFKLSGTDYVTVNDLIIKALGTESNEYGFAAHVKGSANNNTFNNCQFNSNITSDLANYAAFVMNDNDTSCTSWSQSAVANNLTVNNCTTTGGYYGMAICGAAISYTPAENIIVSNNEINDFYYRGLAVIGANNSLIEVNTISRPERTNGANIDMLHLASYQNGTIISKNIITGFSSVSNSNSANGITSNQLIASSGGGLLIANNLIYGFQNMNGGQTGIILNTYSGSDNYKLYHNTVSLDNTSHGGSSSIFCLSMNGSNYNVELKNNIFSFTTSTTGNKYIYYFGTSSGTILTSNNNVLHMGYTVGTSPRCAYKFPTNYITLANWQTAGYDVNGTGADPAFINPLRTPTNAAVANIGANLLTVVPDDINGASRTTTPDPGVLEFVPQTCLQPTAITLTNYSAAFAIFNWTEQGTATLWNTEVGAVGFTPGTGTAVVTQTGVNSKPWTANGLSANTAYDFYVRSDCGGGDLSAWAGPYQFRTLCNNITDFDEDFDGVTQPSLPDCWRKAGEAGAISSYANQPYSSPNNLAITSINSTVIMPPVSNAGAGTHMLRLWGKVLVNLQTARLHIGYLTNPTDPTTFVMLDSVKFNSTSYNEYDIYLGTAPGANNILAIKSMSTHGFYLDDIRWIPICPAPTAQNLTAFTSSTANFAWTESGSATLWDVEVGVGGFLPGTGTATASGTDITSTTWQATGLSPNTAYDFYVRADCGFNYSSWVGPITFTTPCVASSLPLIENIDGTSFPDCWQPTVSDIWSASNSSSAGGLPYELKAGYKSYTGISRLIAPLINTSGLNVINLKFLTTLAPNTTGAVLKIQSSADGVNWTDEDWSKNSNQFVLGAEVDIDITNNLGDITYIAWVIDGNHMAYNNWRVDNVQITGCSPCTNLSVSNLTPASADLTWNAGDSETLWNIEWGTDGFTFGTGTRINEHNNTTYNLSSLTPNTSYSFYVQADCVSDTSEWTGPYTFQTECTPISSLPWIEGFEDVTAPEFPDCWTFGNGGWATQINAYSTMDADARTGTQFLTDNWNAINEYIWTPGFELTGGTAYDLSFWWAGDNYPGWTGEVFYNTAHNASGATALGSAFVEAATTTDKIYREVLRTFTPSANGVYYFALKINSTDTDEWYISFDDFLLEEAPPCGTPTEATASNITSTSVDLTWTAASNQTLWDVELGLSGFTPGTGTSVNSYTGISNTTWQLTNLTPNTAYDFYVRAQCTGGGYSYWADKVSFTTDCGVFGLPYEDGFENNVCWTQVDIDGSGAHWGITTSTNHTTGGTTSAYHNYGASGYAETGMLYSPQIVFPTGVTIELTFWSYNALPLSYGKNSLLISTDGTNYTEIWSPVSVTEAWVQTTLDLSAYAGNTIKLAFKYEGTFAHRWYVDDVKITQNLNVSETNQLISSNATYENVTVEPSGELTLNTGNSLTVHGDFIIESDENGTGSFIQNGTLNVAGDIIVEKYLPNTTVTGWTLSLPVQSATDAVFDGSDDIWYFNSSQAAWQSFSGGTLQQMTGYVVRFPLTTTINFTGTLNSISMSRNNLIRSSSPNNFGWNYVGNPYPSPIDWDANPGISTTNLNNAIYFRRWNGIVASYVDGVGNNGGSRYIPSMQAFWVQVTQGETTGTLEITRDAQVHTSNNTYKNIPNNVLHIKIEKEGFQDEAVIRFTESASEQFDGYFDAYKMFSYNNLQPQIYSFADAEELAINALPVLTSHTMIPIGIKTTSDGPYSIVADGLSTFNNHIGIWLEDIAENTMIDLRINNICPFNASSGIDNNRFVLHFISETSGENAEILEKNDIKIYTFNNYVYISTPDDETLTVKIYNMIGQVVLNQQLNPNTLNKINTNLCTGNYIVKVFSNNNTITQKVYLK